MLGSIEICLLNIRQCFLWVYILVSVWWCVGYILVGVYVLLWVYCGVVFSVGLVEVKYWCGFVVYTVHVWVW